MLVSLRWLQEYVDLTGCDIAELRKKMSAAGLSVEREYLIGDKLEHIRIGRIIEKEAHPDSTHLWITKVELDTVVLQIVTGAQNISVGDTVPVVLSGNCLPGGHCIETTTLRGIESQGMMCSEKELGVGDDHEGILLLDRDAPVGVSFSDYYGYPDTVFDIEITPNRGDLLSIYGIAREVSVLIDRTLVAPHRKVVTVGSLAMKQPVELKVLVDDSKDCDRFSIVEIAGDFSKSTPFYIKQRLLRAGMRPKSLLVDLSNYIMLELGQPNHAYDAALLAGRVLRVRRAGFGEELVLLDDTQLSLDPTMLVIADGQKAVGLAGIMGGEATKIRDNTERIVIEAAHFDSVVIRKTTMKTNIRSEASARFERKVDPTLTESALERYYYLLSEITTAEIVTPLVEVNHYQRRGQEVSLRSSLLTTYLGKDLSLTYVERLLVALGFEIVDATHAGEHGGWHIRVKVPSWRWSDVTIEEDLIEEIARMYGYEHINYSTPRGRIPLAQSAKSLEVKRSVLEAMVSRGWWELLTYSFNSEDQIVMSGYAIEQAVKVHNPLVQEHGYMRLSLLPNLLEIARRNSTSYPMLSLFEISRVYHQKVYGVLPDEIVDESLEREYFSGLYLSRQTKSDILQVKSELDSLFGMLKVSQVEYSQDKERIESLPISKMFHTGRCAVVLKDSRVLGIYGELHPQIMTSLGFQKPVYIFELAMDQLVELTGRIGQYRPFSVYPKTTETLSYLVDSKIPAQSLYLAISEVDERITSVRIADVYAEGQLESGHKAVTVEVSYQKMDGVVQSKEAEEIRKAITKSLSDLYAATLRSQ